jgi:hypothetical protein
MDLGLAYLRGVKKKAWLKYLQKKNCEKRTAKKDL